MNRIQYTLTEQDLLNFYLFNASTYSIYVKQIRSYRILFSAFCLICAFFILLLNNERAYILAGSLALVAGIWSFISPQLIRRRYRKHYQNFIQETQSNSLEKPVVYELQSDGILVLSHLGESKYRYDVLDNIVENDGYTYLFLGRNMGLILPHDRIPKDKIQEFLQRIEAKKTNK